MNKPALAALQRELPQADLAGFETLSAAESEQLAAAIRGAREQHRREFERALAHALRLLPWPWSRAVRKVMFP